MGMFWCKSDSSARGEMEGGPTQPQSVNETYLRGRDPSVGALSLCRGPCCGVV